ncbi:FadR/GntR family transcriptional regulator [Puerhibacterium puerhi]|uniref:FadR/GntR family transcriptional regulator n=1 Tax=Puerhibacterium puerhi TaxID=2692623 RepID=UPI00135997F8|nr:FadR/GntR family transcriptional regulator [Puerhibacterium puerhi]
MPEAEPTDAASAASSLPTRGLLTERVARRLEADIRKGVLVPGSKLPSERRLAEEFGASRNVVREALRRLEAHGLLDVEPGRGSFVRESTDRASGFEAEYRSGRATVRQLIEARMPLEVEIAGLAAARATDADLGTLERAQQRMVDAVDPVEKARADVGFHDAIAAASGNPVLRSMLAAASNLMFEMMLRSNTDPRIAEPGVPHHPEILAAIAAHDVDLARERMREHLALGLRTYGPDLDLSLDAMATRHIESLLAEAKDEATGGAGEG